MRDKTTAVREHEFAKDSCAKKAVLFLISQNISLFALR